MNDNAEKVVPENFVTLFDSNFLPMGLCLYRSLCAHMQSFRLWVVCMDELVEKQLIKLDLPNVSIIPLRKIETEELRQVKLCRTAGEYCWTLTPFVPEAVFNECDDVSRVTYLDADLFFFASPQSIFLEFEKAHKDVLITDHGYAPQYRHYADTHGRFCVQFMVFNRNEGGLKIMRHWQAECLEWCYAREEDGKFGDQKYLDAWPSEFRNEVHILERLDKALAPWNVDWISKSASENLNPVFFHFHSFRIEGPRAVKLFEGFRIGSYGMRLYKAYLDAVKSEIETMKQHGFAIPCMPPKSGWIDRLRRLKKRVLGTARFALI